MTMTTFMVYDEHEAMRRKYSVVRMANGADIVH